MGCGPSFTYKTPAEINLGPLADNGGLTPTMALSYPSAAIDAGDNATCAAAPVNNLDQRGAQRPADGDGTVGADCDIGAYEYCPADNDADGVCNPGDNCPNWYNPLQTLPPWTVPADDADCDGFAAATEQSVGSMPLVPCPATGVGDGIDNDGDTAVDEAGEGANDEAPDAWPPDANDDQKVNVGDVILLFAGKILNPPAYQARSDFDGNGSINIGDVIIGFSATVQIFDQCVPWP
jgi:hypothetical protein